MGRVVGQLSRARGSGPIFVGPSRKMIKLVFSVNPNIKSIPDEHFKNNSLYILGSIVQDNTNHKCCLRSPMMLI